MYVLEKVVVILEYTTSSSGKLSDHLKKKALLYTKITSDPTAFIKWARSTLRLT